MEFRKIDYQEFENLRIVVEPLFDVTSLAICRGIYLSPGEKYDFFVVFARTRVGYSLFSDRNQIETNEDEPGWVSL